MAAPQLTVLTDPIPYGRYFITEKAKGLLKTIKRMIKPLPHFAKSEKYRGHVAVTRSLVEGLEKNGFPYTYNPASLSDLADSVIVLSGIAALKQAVELKRKGVIRKLLAGPNIMVFPSEHMGLLLSPEVDVCITPCDWTCNLYVNVSPSLQGRCVAWAAGVDTTYWSPAAPGSKEASSVLLFIKQAKPDSMIREYVEILGKQGYRIEVIRYGHYTPADYLSSLRRSSLIVGFSGSESQGIAWAEAWSADVPTLLWNQDHDTYQGVTFASSSAPYLSDATGLFFTSPESFEASLQKWEADRLRFTPRQWVLENMSDEVCARRLCELAKPA